MLARKTFDYVINLLTSPMDSFFSLLPSEHKAMEDHIKDHHAASPLSKASSVMRGSAPLPVLLSPSKAVDIDTQQ